MQTSYIAVSLIKKFNLMRGVNQVTAKRIFKLWKMAQDNDGHIKIDNTEGAFMPVNVECIGGNSKFHFISICHYGEQNGDLMRDPEICYAIAKNTVGYAEKGDFSCFWVAPFSFRNDYMGMMQEFLFFNPPGVKEGEIRGWKPGQFNDNVSFSRMWMKNIWDQQELK